VRPSPEIAAPVATPALSWSMRSAVCSTPLGRSTIEVTARTVWSKVMPAPPRYPPASRLSCFDGT
jgi:hypothetical protein